MAQSTRAILNNGNCRVADGDKTWTQSLPDWMHLSDADLESLDSLKEAVGEQRLLALAHKGLVQSVIDVRAQARYKDKAGEYTGNPTGYEPNLLPEPTKSKAEKALESMSAEELEKLLKAKGLK